MHLSSLTTPTQVVLFPYLCWKYSTLLLHSDATQQHTVHHRIENANKPVKHSDTCMCRYTHSPHSIKSPPQSQRLPEKQKTHVEPLSCEGPAPKSNLNQFCLIRCHGIHYIIIIPLTQGWIFNECNCRQIVGHNCVK